MIIIGSDHAGTTLKQNIISYLKSKNIEYMDINEDNKEDAYIMWKYLIPVECIIT